MKDTKFTAHSQYHVTSANEVPQYHRTQYFDPELPIHYTSFIYL